MIIITGHLTYIFYDDPIFILKLWKLLFIGKEAFL